MTTIEVRMVTGKYRTLEFQKPFEDKTASEIMEELNGCIWGWTDITEAEHIVLGHNINDICGENDAPEPDVKL